ncbi:MULTISPECIES: LysR family transcriptional regulator [Bradyrhizobium]|uniref:LysR family transcriptional regulator n=1 Tax=Bradyrhizobium elkanii TaxID=29448 RepID=A0A4U6S629_BRAEL|nr:MULTISPECIES: LysR family transcriptional regulator [Bradyrhizobium]MTV12700.1 LysR family transcriptional regulator [Bradyrhizobium sp. BR2003]TKV82433.1 LysR family transcriptional regulator [Bradyrhizobium elkanii]
MQDIERARRRIKLRDLHILLVIAQRGSMAKAAAELAVSQPAISRAVSDMEHALGLRLFDRCRNGIELTAYGHALVRRGVSIFDELTQGLQELEFLADPSVGELRIGSTESIAAGLLPVAIDRFTRQQPGIRINVAQTVLSDLRYRELRERNIDLLLGWTPTPFDEADLAVEPLLDDRRVVVAGRRSKWARASRLALADLADERWVLPPPDTFPGSAVAEMFHKFGMRMPSAPVTTLSLHLCCRLAATGRFIAVLPGSVARFAGGDLGLKVLPVQLPRAAAVSAAIVTLKGRTLGPTAEIFIACIREVAKAAASKAAARK